MILHRNVKIQDWLLSCFILLGSQGCNANAVHLLVLSDPHLDASKHSHMQIKPKRASLANELDTQTFDDMLSKIQYRVKVTKPSKKPEAIVILGDLSAHRGRSNTDVKQNLSTTFKHLYSHFHSIPMFYVFGNNDSPVSDYGVFESKVGESPYVIAKNSGWYNGFLSTGHYCRSSKPPCILDENYHKGYFSGLLNHNLRLIALNSVAFSKHNHQEYNKAFNWLKQQLEQAKQSHEAVIIAMHIPVGKSRKSHKHFWRNEPRHLLVDLLNQYRHQILCILTGTKKST